MDLEAHIGEWGRFQAAAFAVGCFVSTTNALYVMTTVFTMTPPKHRCLVLNVDIESNSSANTLLENSYFDHIFSAPQPYDGWFHNDKALREKYFTDPGDVHAMSASMCHYCPDIQNQNNELTSENFDNKDIMEEALNGLQEGNQINDLIDQNDTGTNLSNINLTGTSDNVNNICTPTRAIECDNGIVYDRSQFYSTLVETFNIACDSRAWKRQLASSLYMVGLFLGSLIMGITSDRFGRKPTLLISNIIYVIAGFSVALTNENYIIYCILQVVIGTAGMGGAIATYCLVMEFIGKNRRSATGVWYHGAFTIGSLYVGGVAYFVREWQLVVLFSMATGSILMPTVLFLPRSVLWLERNGRFSDALAVIRRIQRFNGVPESAVLNQGLKGDKHNEQSLFIEDMEPMKPQSNEPENTALTEVETNSSSSGYATVVLDNEEEQISHQPSNETVSQSDQGSLIQREKNQPTIIVEKDEANDSAGNQKWICNNIYPAYENKINEKQFLSNKTTIQEVTEAITNLPKGREAENTSNLDNRHQDGEGVSHSQPTQNSYRKLFSHRIMVRHTFVMGIGFTAASITYYGISLNMSLLPGNLYVNYTLSGLIDLPGMLLTVWLLNRVGRRRTLSFLYIFGGSCNVVSACVPSGQTELLVFLTILGKVAACGAFNGIWTYAVEVFPTEARSSGIGIASCMARLGTILAPQIALIAAYTANWVPFCIYGIITVLSGLCIACWAPETKGRPLPQTVEESVALDDFGKNS